MPGNVKTEIPFRFLSFFYSGYSIMKQFYDLKISDRSNCGPGLPLVSSAACASLKLSNKFNLSCGSTSADPEAFALLSASFVFSMSRAVSKMASSDKAPWDCRLW